MDGFMATQHSTAVDAIYIIQQEIVPKLGGDYANIICAMLSSSKAACVTPPHLAHTGHVS